jgi:hypothetical protein
MFSEQLIRTIAVPTPTLFLIEKSLGYKENTRLHTEEKQPPRPVSAHKTGGANNLAHHGGAQGLMSNYANLLRRINAELLRQ